MSENATGRARVVVGIDGSQASREVLRWALRFARTEDALVDVVTAWHIPAAVVAPYSYPLVVTPREDAEKLVTQVVDDVCGHERPTGMTVRVVEGRASDVLLDAADGAELLVVGSRGQAGFRGLMLGSVSQRVAELSPCPVLVVHPEPSGSVE